MSCSIIYLHRLAFPSESGQTIQVLRDYAAMARLGHPVHLFYRAEKPLSVAEVEAVLASYGLHEIPNFSLHLIREGAFGGRRLRRAAADLVRASASGEGVALVCRTLDHALVALRLRGRHGLRVRVVLELHETAIPRMVYREQGRWLRAWWSVWRERRVFRDVDGLICTVGSQLVLLDRLMPRHAPATVLPNGVMPGTATAPAVRSGSTDEVRLRYAGNIGGWKNTDIMIECLAHLPPSVVLEIAGGKQARIAETREQLEQLAARFGVAGRVRYLGVLPPAEVPEFLAGADVLLLPLGENVQSRYFTSPMKLFEYAASGVPMVVTRQPTTESLVADGTHALMTPPGSTRAMAEAVSRLIADREFGRRLAANAAAWVREHSYDNRARRLQNFLEGLFKNR
jgi:glycosyltransferase involved in cell wall biosynthesis